MVHQVEETKARIIPHIIQRGNLQKVLRWMLPKVYNKVLRKVKQTTTNTSRLIMNTFRVKTTSWEEEDLVLLTTLSEVEIQKTLIPIVVEEREGSGSYDNDSLVEALKKEYPKAHVEQYPTDLPTIYI